ncbi:uncharacterized protein LOC135847781 [Planococcus citri]|uniref:uncharacterized protein LOC135847781 n=1 Tax=Planococcus citri TaxID=170843 RepID=UPI0031F97178
MHRNLAVWITLGDGLEKFSSKVIDKNAKTFVNELIHGKIKSDICVIDQNNKPSFIHLPFAEYFTADCIWEEFKIVDSANIGGFIDSIIIQKLVNENKEQVFKFLRSKVQKDLGNEDFVESEKERNNFHTSNKHFVDLKEKLETLIKMLSQKVQVVFCHSFTLLLEMIEFILKNHQVKITNITSNFEDVEDVERVEAHQHSLLSLCAEKGFEEIAKALTANKKMNKEIFKKILKREGWKNTMLMKAIDHDQFNIANLLTEMYDASIIKDTLEDFINTILAERSNKYLEYVLKTNQFEVCKPYTINNEQKLLLFEALGSSSSSLDQIKFLIDKTDVDVINKFLDFHRWDMVICQWNLFWFNRGEEAIMHAMKKGINIFNAVNISLYACITFIPVRPGFPEDVKHCFKMIKLLFESGVSFNCKNIDVDISTKYKSRFNDQELDLNNFSYDRKCKSTTLRYSKQIYVTYKLLNRTIKLLDEEKCVNIYGSINKIFKLIIINYRKCTDLVSFKANSEGFLISYFEPESSDQLFPKKTWKEITLPSFKFTLNLPPGYRFTDYKMRKGAPLQLLQTRCTMGLPCYERTFPFSYSYSSTMRNALQELPSLINKFKDLLSNCINDDNFYWTDEYKILLSNLDYFKEHLLNEVLVLSKANGYSIDRALDKISREVQIFIELHDKIEEVRSRSQSETFSLTIDDILSIWDAESDTSNDTLQNVTSVINDECDDIYVVCNALTSLWDNFLRRQTISENISNLENESKCFYKLLEDLDKLYNDLSKAIITKNHEEIKHIMEKNYTYKQSIINGQDEKLGSPLHYVACKGDVETAKLLLFNGANPNLRLNETGTPELLSTFENLEQMGGSEDWPMDYYSWTPLHLAALKGHNEIVQVLIDKGARINIQVVTISETICNGYTPLHLSIMQNHLKTAQLLLQNGACYDVKNSQNKTPLELTTCGSDLTDLLQCIRQLFQAVDGECRKDLVRSLLERNDLDSLKAILNAKNSDNHTLLDTAQANEHEEIVDLLNKKIEIFQCDMEDGR